MVFVYKSTAQTFWSWNDLQLHLRRISTRKVIFFDIRSTAKIKNTDRSPMEIHILFEGRTNRSSIPTYHANTLDDKGSPDLRFWIHVFEILIVFGITLWLIRMLPPLIPRRQVIGIRSNGRAIYAREGFILRTLRYIGINDIREMLYRIAFATFTVYSCMEITNWLRDRYGLGHREG
jgi:hypothetical protein